MRQKGGDARSRTPSPMYLELQSSKIDIGFGEANSESSGGHTPRGNDFISAKNSWNITVPMNLRGEVKKQQLTPGMLLPAQARVWSTMPGSAGPLAGELRETNVGVSAPWLSQENVSSTFPVPPVPPVHPAVRVRGYPQGGSYTGFPPTDSKVAPEATASFGYHMPGPLDPAKLPPAPAGFNEWASASGYTLASIGTRGHPNSCEKGCKYVWKKRGCRDGVNCLHCHLCRPNSNPQVAKPPQPKSTDLASNVQPKAGKPASIGSIGHPHSCSAACKYNGKKAGCKDGKLCNRCHVCRWSRCTDRMSKDANVGAESQVKSKTCEMSTQTTVDQCTQCDLSNSEEEATEAEATSSKFIMESQKPIDFGEVQMSFSC